ncbi:AEC family transporter [Anaerovorax odorimutans]|uniref:AEC family transporter n=1 Tax=Anaerovorax odorimutans TaxID=109327 RepID=UPI0004068305|nr:AEC family transporter [Anaerovorax odorimutans]
MNILILSFEVVFPIFGMMFLGYYLKCIKMFDDKTLKVMNNVVFRVFLPLLLFINVYQTNLKEAFNIKLVSYALICILLEYMILFVLIPRLSKNRKRCGAIIQGCFRSNFVLFGLPITIELFGNSCAGHISLLIAAVVPVYNFLAVIVLETFRGTKADFKKLIKGIITNPLIIASALGVLSLLLHIRIPEFLESTMVSISNIATPLALILLGASFHFFSVKHNLKPLIFAVMGRLVIIPGVVLPIGIYLGFRGIEIGALLAVFASPTAISSFVMAQQMDSDDELAGQIVVFTSTFSIITVFLWVAVLKVGGFI